MATQTAPPTTDDSPLDYMQVALTTLVPGKTFSSRLFVEDSEKGGFRLYKSEDVPFEEKDRQKLLANGTRSLWIRKSEHEAYQDYLRENLSATLADESIPTINRAASLGEVVRDVMSSTFKKGDTDDIVDQTSSLAENCVGLLSRDDIMAADLVGVLHHDYHTFTHSTNVSFYAVMLAKAVGINNEKELGEIAIGGFVHDLGKLEIPESILTKPGRLTDEEFGVIRDHPRSGFRKLCQRSDMSRGQLMMTYQHHERLDGRGYPVGCVEADLHLWSKICSVVDVFEALTSNRPYRRAIPRQEVFEMMRRDSGTAFDKEILECWAATISRK